MRISILLFFCTFLFLFSCNKEDCDPSSDEQFNQSFYPLTPGSMWVYQWYRVNPSGEEFIFDDKIDTVKILKDTLINGDFYAKVWDLNSFENNEPRIYYRRDSSVHLVDPNNNIFFSSSNFVDTLYQTINPSAFEVSYRMSIPSDPISTPLGIFDCLNFRGEVTPLIPTLWSERYLNHFYSKGVGLVMENTFFFSAEDDLQRRLIEYHIE